MEEATDITIERLSAARGHQRPPFNNSLCYQGDSLQQYHTVTLFNHHSLLICAVCRVPKSFAKGATLGERSVQAFDCA
jgi:hypothetical protein